MILIAAVWCNIGDLNQSRHSVIGICVFYVVDLAGC